MRAPARRATGKVRFGCGSNSRFTVEESIEAGDRVIELWTYTWADGHVRSVDVFRVRDGKVCEKLAYVKG